MCVGDAKSTRNFSPPMKDPAKAKKAAEQLGEELAKQGARLLVYGGPFIEADVVRDFVAGNPAQDRSIIKWYTKDQEPQPFPEESSHPKLFDQRVEKGIDWEIAFYRSIARADGVALIGGENATKIVGQVAIGLHIPIVPVRIRRRSRASLGYAFCRRGFADPRGNHSYGPTLEG